MKRVFLIFAAAGILITSCKKDESNKDPLPQSTVDYMQLKIGNYWVYERYHVDTLGNETPFGQSDSLVITGDTIIRGYTYYKKQNVVQGHTSYLRDSSGYLVDQLGKILFSHHDFKNILRLDTIGPGLAIIEYKMYNNDTLISIDMGNYQCLDFIGTVTSLQSNYPYGTQYTYYFWADGLGMIRSNSYYYSNPHLRTGQSLKDFGNLEN